MNQAPGDHSLQWSEAEQMDAMGAIQDLDFANFLDIGDLDLTSFSPVTHDHQPHHPHQDGVSDPQQRVDAQTFQPNPVIDAFSADPFELPMAMDQEQLHHVQPVLNESHEYGDHGRSHPNTPSWTQQSQQQSHPMQAGPVYQPQQHVPPTPNSYEMHGNPGRYLQQHMDPQTRAFLEQRYQLKKDDAMAFTPLVSPAVTPQDSQFHSIPEYTVPGAYFSPLTSPALQAQNGINQHYQLNSYQHPSASTAPSSVATSPIDLNSVDVDMIDGSTSTSKPPRRTVRKTQAPRSAGPAARVRQSPIVKPLQKRRSTHLSSVIPSKEMDSIIRDAHNAQPLSAGINRGAQFIDSSGTESISPEPLSESLMGPPPRPVSALQSPALHPQPAPIAAVTSAPSANGMNAGPATPASLMALQRPPKSNLKRRPGDVTPQSVNDLPLQLDDTAMLDDFTLPPAANTNAPRPLPDRIVTSGLVSADATPRLSARKTPKLGPNSTPLSALGLTSSANSSPSISAVNSPSAATPASMKGRKIEPAPGAKGSRKRGSMGGPLISPAIRPKISPSIKPLLPEGAKLSESQQALLLASKSNYTHILEGTLLPGVTYPESLSSGLTSKRTSHKIAEQGRRNRINDALKEMQALLPRPGGKAGSADVTPDGPSKANDEDDETKASTAEGKSASSKAATVESAIEYIKALQQERLQTVQMLKQKDAEMAALRQRLQSAGLDNEEKSEVEADSKEENGVDATQ